MVSLKQRRKKPGFQPYRIYAPGLMLPRYDHGESVEPPRHAYSLYLCGLGFVAAESFPVGYGQGIVVLAHSMIGLRPNPRYSPLPSPPPHLTNPTNPPTPPTPPTSPTSPTLLPIHPPPSPSADSDTAQSTKSPQCHQSVWESPAAFLGIIRLSPFGGYIPSSDRGPSRTRVSLIHQHHPGRGRAVWQRAAFQVLEPVWLPINNNRKWGTAIATPQAAPAPPLSRPPPGVAAPGPAP